MQRYESYKPSEVAWLGNVPSQWDVQPLRAVTSLKSDKKRPDLPVLSVYREYGVILKDSRDDNHNATSLDTSTYKVVKPGDLVVNKMKAWQGSMGVSAHEGIVSPAYITCTTREDRVRPAYLHYLLRSSPLIGVYNSLSYGVRVGQWDMHYEDFKQIPVPLPPKDEQDRIVAFLDQKAAEIDAAIAKKERLIELLGEQKEGLISRAVLLGLNEQVELRKSSVKWLKNIPKGWEVLPCRYLFREVTRRDRDGSEQKLSVTQKNGLVPTDLMAEHSTQAQSFDEFKLCHVGDLVLNKYKAHLGVFWAAKVRGIITNNYTVFKPTKKAFPPYFELLFHTKWMCDQFASVVYGVVDGMTPLYTKDFYSVPTICPPFQEQQEIVSYCGEVTKKIDSAIAQEERAIQLLRELKTTLVASYVMGRARV